MQELGPFWFHSDGKTLYRNRFAWNKGTRFFFSISTCFEPICVDLVLVFLFCYEKHVEYKNAKLIFK